MIEFEGLPAKSSDQPRADKILGIRTEQISTFLLFIKNRPDNIYEIISIIETVEKVALAGHSSSEIVIG